MAANGEKQQGHRPGVYKQKNKGHKHGKHRTKGEIERENKGTQCSLPAGVTCVMLAGGCGYGSANTRVEFSSQFGSSQFNRNVVLCTEA